MDKELPVNQPGHPILASSRSYQHETPKVETRSSDTDSYYECNIGTMRGRGDDGLRQKKDMDEDAGDGDGGVAEKKE